MADDILVTEPAGGKAVATDELTGGRHAQLIKLVHGADGIGNMVQDADPLPTVSRFAVPLAARLSMAPINVAASGDNLLLSGTALQTIRVFRVVFVASAAVNWKFRNGTSDFWPFLPAVANTAVLFDFDGEPWYVTSAGNALQLNLSAAVQVSGAFYYMKS